MIRSRIKVKGQGEYITAPSDPFQVLQEGIFIDRYGGDSRYNGYIPHQLVNPTSQPVCLRQQQSTC